MYCRDSARSRVQQRSSYSCVWRCKGLRRKLSENGKMQMHEVEFRHQSLFVFCLRVRESVCLCWVVEQAYVYRRYPNFPLPNWLRSCLDVGVYHTGWILVVVVVPSNKRLITHSTYTHHRVCLDSLYVTPAKQTSICRSKSIFPLVFLSRHLFCALVRGPVLAGTPGNSPTVCVCACELLLRPCLPLEQLN